MREECYSIVKAGHGGMARVANFCPTEKLNGSAHRSPWAPNEPSSHVAFRAAPGEQAACLPYLEENNSLRFKLPCTQPVELVRHWQRGA